MYLSAISNWLSWHPEHVKTSDMSLIPLVVGNWKLNLLSLEATALIDKLMQYDSKVQVAVAPVVTLLAMACERTRGSKLQIGAQNVFYASQGAYTGEWSVAHLKELGVSMAIVGHSERRQYFGEDSESVALKAEACLDGGVTPIVCIGESFEQRQAGQTEAVLAEQLAPLLKHAELVLAYEPIWAIGTGVNATVAQVAEVHAFLRHKRGEGTRLLYGGSVKPENAVQLAAVPEVNGFLVGGASLQAESFLKIIEAF